MIDKIYDDNGNEIISEEVIGSDKSAYLEVTRTVKYTTKKYNPKYGDNRLCVCGHEYYRHFDSWEDMYPCGCKYCSCGHFREDDGEKYVVNKDITINKMELHIGDELTKVYDEEEEKIELYKDGIYICCVDSLFEKMHTDKIKK